MSEEHERPSADSLMARFQLRGDPDAFEQIVSRFLAPALNVAREITRDSALAEDAVQEAFLRVVRSRRRYLPSKPFSTWFYAILRNVCRDLLRHAGRQAKLLRAVAAETPVSAGPASAAAAESDAAAAAMKLLDRLPEAERSVLTLRIVGDLPLREVAAALDISYEAAKKRAQRALRTLRRLGGK